MKSLIMRYRLSFLIILCFAVSCKKSRSLHDENEKTYSVSFKLTGFTSQVYPLQSSVKKISKPLASSNAAGNSDTDYLYFWSFNDGTLMPDVMFHSGFNAEIVYIDEVEPWDFVSSTYEFEGYGGGQAVVFNKGIKQLLIKMPLPIGTQLGELAFDVGSPDTGPKSFDIYYSLDKGNTYEILNLDNQFEDPIKENGRHSFSYNLSEVTLGTEGLWFKIAPKAGDRGVDGKKFSETSGRLRMDNLRITGIAPPSDLPYDEVHYFVFSKESDELVASGREDLTGLRSINLSLAHGDYQVFFISNASDQELELPNVISLQNLYVSNTFSNANAEIFGYKGDLSVNEDQTFHVELVRLYSQVKIEFTDLGSLSEISKIEVQEVHVPFFYAPFNPSMQNPVSDESTIILLNDFEENRHVLFNQFLGMLETPMPVRYLLHVYVDDQLLRSVELESAIKNNMQLVFKGVLFVNQEENNFFQIVKNVIWDDEIVVGF